VDENDRHAQRGIKAVAQWTAIVIALLATAPGYGQQAPAGAAQSSTATPAEKPSPAIFVTNPSANSLSVFPLGSKGNAASRFTRTMLSNPSAIAYHAGKLYVANGSDDSITVYPANGGPRPNPIITISGAKTKLVNPQGIAVDSAGNIFVANQGSVDFAPAGVTIYRAGANGDVAPIARISGPTTGLESPVALALDARGFIYVANQINSQKTPDRITVYAPHSNGNAAPIRMIAGPATGLSNPGGVAVDSVGDLFVTSAQNEKPYCCSAAVLIYAPGATGNVAPIASIDGDCGKLSATGAIALGANGNIYVTDPAAPMPEGVFVFTQQDLGTRAGVQGDQFSLKPILTYSAHGSPTMIPAGPQCLTPTARITGDKTRIDTPSGIAVDPAGNIYVTNSDTDSINVFPAGANGNATPSYTMESPTGVDDANAVAIDSHGQIYVANGGGEILERRLPDNSVSIYPAGSYANVAPIARIGGPADDSTENADQTGISAPQAIAVDSHGKIFVANREGGSYDQGKITVFVAGSHGDVRLIATIGGTRTGDNTGLNDPVGMAIDAAGNLYVLNQSGGPDKAGSITVFAPDANGNVAPRAAIANDAKAGRTQLKWPMGLALDASGNMYVTNQAGTIAAGPDSVTIYAAGKFGNVAPIGIITGSHTGLKRPHGIGIDAEGKIYVSNDGSGGDISTDDGSDDGGIDTVTVYAPGSRGDAAPIATISGSLTGLKKPGGLAVGP